ncbi:MAG: hypothetical protein AAFQ52_17545 [Chloroflexota bacterium]
MNSIELIFLSQAVIFSALTVVFLLISRWAIGTLREYAGYGLGWLMALFFFMVYISLGGTVDNTPANAAFLTMLDIFIATIMGIFAGVGVLLGFRLGMQYVRIISLQVAIYTALNLILLVLLVIEGPIAQRMIGIFSLALGIVALFGAVMFPTKEREEEINIRTGGTQGSRPIDVGQGGANMNPNMQQPRARNRLEQMRNDLAQRDQRRQ